MKDKLLDIYKFISQVLIIFSATVLFISFVGIFVGESAREYSTMFSLGSKGIAFDTVLQILLSSIVISSIDKIFLSEKILKKLSGLWKRILMIISIIAAIVIFIICFKWFPVNLVEAWIGFFVSFVGFFTVSTVVMLTKTKREAKKYDELLENYKKRHVEGGDRRNEGN